MQPDVSNSTDVRGPNDQPPDDVTKKIKEIPPAIGHDKEQQTDDIQDIKRVGIYYDIYY